MGDTSMCLNLQFSHLQRTLMLRQMDKIRVNVCEELPKGPGQMLGLDINNRLEVLRDLGEDKGEMDKNDRKR